MQGKEGPRLLLAGWLAARLRATPELVEGRHASMRIDCTGAVFAVTREARLLHGRVEIDGAVVHEATLALADDTLPWSLGRALTHLGPPGPLS